MKSVNRKTMLYKTGVEYGDYTVNHVVGCSHGCTYPCYAYMMAHRFGAANTIEEWMEPYICENAIDILKKELPKLKHKIKSVQLCFSTDPFMYNNKMVSEKSIDIIKLINEFNIPCTILTKGILPMELSNLNGNNEYGITLVSLDEGFRKRFEPGASPYIERIQALEKLHKLGCKTWVSIEPYPTPNVIVQNLTEILEAISFVDYIVFGRLHYNKIVSEYKDFKNFYNKCAEEVVSFCEKHDIKYHIKSKTITK